MATLSLRTLDDQVHYRPGEDVSGVLGWSLDAPPEAIEVRLFWYTRGKGTQDVAIADSFRLEKPPVQGECDFHFTLPDGPYSFSGKLISLIWAIEAIVEPSGQTQRLDLTMSPTAQEIHLAHNR